MIWVVRPTRLPGEQALRRPGGGWREAYYIALCLLSASANAAPPSAEPGPYSEWFQELTAPDTGIKCCGEADCRYATWRYHLGHYEVLLDGRWTVVPDEKVMEDAVFNPTGRPVICASRSLGVMCFVPPPPG